MSPSGDTGLRYLVMWDLPLGSCQHTPSIACPLQMLQPHRATSDASVGQAPHGRGVLGWQDLRAPRYMAGMDYQGQPDHQHVPSLQSKRISGGKGKTTKVRQLLQFPSFDTICSISVLTSLGWA